jgi:hypothetical protein
MKLALQVCIALSVMFVPMASASPVPMATAMKMVSVHDCHKTCVCETARNDCDQSQNCLNKYAVGFLGDLQPQFLLFAPSVPPISLVAILVPNNSLPLRRPPRV